MNQATTNLCRQISSSWSWSSPSMKMILRSLTQFIIVNNLFSLTILFLNLNYFFIYFLKFILLIPNFVLNLYFLVSNLTFLRPYLVEALCTGVPFSLEFDPKTKSLTINCNISRTEQYISIIQGLIYRLDINLEIK